MKRISMVAAVVLAAAVLAACKGDTRTTTFAFSPDAGSSPGYEPGTPVTLLDGTPVTTPSGSPVTTPELKDSKGNPITTTKKSGSSGGTGSSTGGGSNGSGTGGNGSGGTTGSGGPTTTGFVQPTGTTVVSSKPNTYALAFPKQGVYGFHEKLTPDDGGTPTDQDVFYNLKSPDQNKQIRWQRSQADGTPTEAEYYVESHDTDGLWLVESSLIGGGKCSWSPKSGEMPKSIVDKIGTTVTTDSSCTATVNDNETEFKLHTEVTSIDIEQLLIGGKAFDCIKIERNRELKVGGTTFTTTAHDWYAFDLGFRVKVSDHTTVKTPDGESATVRDLVLTKLA